MLSRFPPAPAEATDASFLTGKKETFAKLKIESKMGQRTVLMTEHTLIFVLKGTKLLHFPEETVKATPGSVVLLRKGIYVMAEYVEDGLDFEALMLFLPGRLLQSMAVHGEKGASHEQFLVFPSPPAINGFKEGFRRYFEDRPSEVESLLPLKQQEILLLLLSGSERDKVRRFIRSAVGSEPSDIDFIVRSYLFQPVTIADLAGLANCSLAKFKRDFQQRHQCSPHAWITTQRLSHASMLLQHTNQQVGAVALECGFESTSHFIRLFKKEYGYTPAAGRIKATIV
ncbi:helix-turn-helix transcriptional regulator [Dinghuibacter silviterrae]|uniref:AraC-type transcriptional regulator n=1 Tax=Dinghuibacter silviterrae TaxID=1539049 RepID=A0A4R8DR86_9BACT|nr:helix-turn-helix domain-containing protein [Dinghuibacter silviterrae]TDX00336.1 AraC-type transcriptional regulator [Dinghuibacter silviterrae]